MIKRQESELAAHGFAWEEGLHFPLTKKETTAIVTAALGKTIASTTSRRRPR
jgi:hypothetical protein